MSQKIEYRNFAMHFAGNTLCLSIYQTLADSNSVALYSAEATSTAQLCACVLDSSIRILQYFKFSFICAILIFKKVIIKPYKKVLTI